MFLLFLVLECFFGEVTCCCTSEGTDHAVACLVACEAADCCAAECTEETAVLWGVGVLRHVWILRVLMGGCRSIIWVFTVVVAVVILLAALVVVLRKLLVGGRLLVTVVLVMAVWGWLLRLVALTLALIRRFVVVAVALIRLLMLLAVILPLIWWLLVIALIALAVVWGLRLTFGVAVLASSTLISVVVLSTL